MTKRENLLIVILGVSIFIAYWSGALNWFFNDSTEAEFLRNVALAVTSIAIGIPTGLEINRIWHKIQDNHRKIQLLIQLKNVFIENLGYLNAVVREMNEGLLRIPSFPLDLVTLDATSQYRYELITNSELLSKIDKAHFELIHVNRRLEIQQQSVSRKVQNSELSIPEKDSLVKLMKKHNELVPLAKRLCGEDLKGIPQMPIYASDESIFMTKKGTIKLAVGLSDYSEKEQDRLHNGGGAYGYCKTAIDAIHEELKKLGYTNSES